ncbi:MAG: 50S ribosomal protein L11 methyltransferase [Deltaproteobacteria bacterium]|nr:50S ribosomal protein L11 methyltransferase [Deltaproteobacteria bacterium]
MNQSELKPAFTKKMALCPYEHLFIYHINGVVRDDAEEEFGESFIGSWVEDSYSFLFFNEPSPEEIDQFLGRHRNLSLIEDYCFSYDQWQGGDQDVVKVEKLRIIPPWRECASQEDMIDILLDPGVVFGNALHPTTRDCLKAILIAADEKSFSHVLDIGTGTGILALAAAYLGAASVIAIDLNPLCVKTAEWNVELNRMGNIIKVFEGAAEESIDEEADLVLANIHYDVILKLLEKEGFRNKRIIILSGLMRSQARDLKYRIKKHDLVLLREWDHEMTWHTMMIGRNEDYDA